MLAFSVDIDTNHRESEEKTMELTAKEKMEKVRDFRPIDDVFFEVLAQNPKVCQEILRVILEDDALTVIDVVVQSDERNLYGRSVRLDALCVLGNGVKCISRCNALTMTIILKEQGLMQLVLPSGILIRVTDLKM
jgi:hypothetical protein